MVKNVRIDFEYTVYSAVSKLCLNSLRPSNLLTRLFRALVYVIIKEIKAPIVIVDSSKL